MNYKNSIIGSSIAFVVATSCCWLPALILAIGGGSTLLAFSNGLEKYSGLFVILGVVLLCFGIWQYAKRSQEKALILDSILTCPLCSFTKKETMPTDACQYFYECENCKTIMKPQNNDCCVFCSYGTVPCPPIQLDQNCC